MSKEKQITESGVDDIVCRMLNGMNEILTVVREEIKPILAGQEEIKDRLAVIEKKRHLPSINKRLATAYDEGFKDGREFEKHETTTT